VLAGIFLCMKMLNELISNGHGLYVLTGEKMDSLFNVKRSFTFDKTPRIVELGLYRGIFTFSHILFTQHLPYMLDSAASREL
jgi:hypothetical protein